MSGIEILSVVAMLEDLPEEGLVRGQVGTVVEIWVPGIYEVEFCDDNGSTYAMVALKAEQLIQLHHEPVNRAA
jgi:allophanate hydrolase subunit 1